MASDWPIVRLGDVIETNLGKMLDAKKNKGEFKPYLGNSNVRWGLFELDNLAEMRFEDHEDERYRLRNGDLVICEGGEPGRCAIWRDELPEMRIQKALHRVRAKQGLTNHYLYYWINLAARTGVLEPYFTGTTIKHLTGRALAELRLPLPPMSVQMDVVDVLGAIDARIDNLRQTNATLEAIAQALFKSWFVDFDPVHAKAEGREPEGMDAATAALFPSEFEDSELGLIPKGWRAGGSDELLEIVGGGTPKTSVDEYWGGDIPWFSVVDAPASGQVFTLDTAKKITALGLANCSAKLLPPTTTIISARGTVGKVAMAGVPMAMNQSCYALRPRVEGGEAFIYFSTLRFVEQLQQIAHGAVFDTVTRDSFKRIMTCLPPEQTIVSFGLMANPLLERIRTNGLQAASLAALRDTLLPRLISGRLRLTEAEAVIEDLFA